MDNTKNISTKKFFIIDGYSYLFRAYHSMPPLTNPEGTPVGAIYGFTNMLSKLRNRISNSNAEEVFMLIAFDAGRKTFRNDIYPEYKANRPPPPEDLIPQFPIVTDVADALKIDSLKIEGFEADDIIATYAKLADQQNIEVTIVSSDKDLMQLINNNIRMYDPMRDKIIGSDEVVEKFGVTPDKVLDLLALMGDNVDNIPGVPGIGPKTAAELLNNFGSLEEVLERAHEIKQNKRRETLIENKEQALLSKQLAELNFKAPVDIDLNKLKIKEPDHQTLFDFLNKHGFKSLIKNLEKNDPEKFKEIKVNSDSTQAGETQNNFSLPDEFHYIKNKEQLNAAFANAANIKQAAVYLYSNNSKIKLISLAFDESTSYLITPEKSDSKNGDTTPQEDLFSTPTGSDNLLENIDSNADNFEYFFDKIKEISHRKDIEFLFYNSKDFFNHSDINHIFSHKDIHAMHYCLEGTNKSRELSLITEKELGISLPNSKELEKLTEDEQHKTIANSAILTHKLGNLLENKIFDKKLNFIFHEVDNRIITTLSKMERAGITIAPQILNDLSDKFDKKIHILEQDIYKLANCEFNIGSPKQLGEILFETLNISGGKKTKTGQYKTDSDKLEEIAAQGFEIAEKVLEWRSLSKLTNTYTKALIKDINPKTGRVHTNFNITATTTGRLSSNNPNLQNIPIKTENGREIRNAFIAGKGKKLIGADYSQIELRLLSHLAEIEVLQEAFKQGKDIHAATASQVFGADINEVTPEQRRAAKAINFGIIYGQSAFGLAKQLRIERSAAKEYIETYFKQYPGIRKFMDNVILFAKEHEYVTTIHGRKIYLKGINDKNGMTRSFAERAAINAPLQGSAADLIKIAMIQIDNHFNTNKIDAQILLQIHDELIIECDEKISEEIASKIKNIMENVVNLSVPLTVDTKTGNHWGEIH